jgi:hypothetical protein
MTLTLLQFFLPGRDIFVNRIFERRFIEILDLTGSTCEKCNFRSSGKNRTCSNTVATLLNIVGVRGGGELFFLGHSVSQGGGKI